MKLIQENKKNINEIVTALKNGAVLVLPTDTVYGLVCDATNGKAVEKIFEIKKRDRSNPLPVFVKDIEMAEKYSLITKEQRDFLNKNWPGAVTIVLKRSKGSSNGLSPLLYKNDTIALRQPKYNFVLEIMELLKSPLAQTSANISENETPSEIKEVVGQFERQDAQPDVVVGAGDLPKRKPSIIIDLTSDKINILRK